MLKLEVEVREKLITVRDPISGAQIKTGIRDPDDLEPQIEGLKFALLEILEDKSIIPSHNS